MTYNVLSGMFLKSDSHTSFKYTIYYTYFLTKDINVVRVSLHHDVELPIA